MAGTPTNTITYKIRFKLNPEHEIIIGRWEEYEPPTPSRWTDLLNISQLTAITSGQKLMPEKARDVLDTTISELLPHQTTRQDQVNTFFQDFNELIGDTPPFSDIDYDGVNEYLTDTQYAVESGSRISHENKPDAYITRLDDTANAINVGQTLQSMRNKLNTYLTDVDNIVQEIPDQRPTYVNKLRGYLKIRKPNQAIILRPADGGEMEFQREITGTDAENKVMKSDGEWLDNASGPSYLVNGFTITMWVRFIGKTSEGTLFNFGNPLESGGYGFRLDTKINEFPTNSGTYHRYIRLIVNDTLVPRGNLTIRDNHTGYPGTPGGTPGASLGRLMQRSTVLGHTEGHNTFPVISTDDLNEWYFICATFDPTIRELEYATEENLPEDGSMYNASFASFTDKHYWMNHRTAPEGGEGGGQGDLIYQSGLGAKCKVEVISKSDLLRARGFKVPGEDISSNV